MTAFVPAKHYTPTGGRAIDLIVLHSMEANQHTRTAENVANWFAGKSGPAPKASAHWNFDMDSAVRSVRDEDVAYHAPGANHDGLGYEHAGHARNTRADWLTPESERMIDLSTTQAAIDCLRYRIPVEFVDVAGLRAGRRGITTHATVSKAFGRSTHWDPGDGFPLDYYLDKTALKVLAGAAHEPVPVRQSPAPNREAPQGTPGTVLRIGSTGPTVRVLQDILRGAGLYRGSVDGVYGPATATAVRAWQVALGFRGSAVDGIYGPATERATADALAFVAAMGRAPAPATLWPGRLLSLGDRGADVRQIQRQLAHLGWRLAADGAYGHETRSTVIAFQRARGLAADGIVGRRTWNAAFGIKG